MPIRCSYHRTMHSSVGIPSIGASIRSVCPSSLRAYCVIISYQCSDLCVYLMSRIWIKLWCIPWVARMWSSMGNVGTAISLLLLLFNIFSYYFNSHTHCEQCQHHVGVHALQWQSSFHYFWGFICLRGCGIQIASGKPHRHAHVDTTTHTHTPLYMIYELSMHILSGHRCTRIRRRHRCWRSPGSGHSFYRTRFWPWSEIHGLHKSQGELWYWKALNY